jgi:hypothetical protein
MTASSLASDETTSSSSLPARTREEGSTFIPSKVKPSSSLSLIIGGNALSCILVSSFMNRFLNRISLVLFYKRERERLREGVVVGWK